MSHIQGLPPLPECFNGLIKVQNTVSISSQGDVGEGTAHCLIVDERDAGINENDKEVDVFNEDEFSEDDNVDTGSAHLNKSLNRLKFEMAGLRKLDISLLYQLWTLHEAIQEYKSVMTDRFSDMGSEYSWGGLSSRAGSITSIDSCDFNDDYRLEPGQSDPSIISSLQGSKTSLIQQIEELKLKAETEF